MDRKDIIEEGWLERYLLGELSSREVLWVEAALTQDADLKKHFDTLEADFEKLAFEQAVEPPKQVLTAVNEHIASKTTTTRTIKPYWIAASLAVLFLTTSIGLWLQLRSTEEALITEQQEKTQLQELLDKDLALAEQNAAYLNILQHHKTEPFVLLGNAKSPSAKLVAYVNHESKKVLVNTNALPQLEDNQTYQLWSDVEGEMIDMGIVPTQNNLIEMKYIAHAESLNITIEPKGGNEHPTVSNLIANILL